MKSASRSPAEGSWPAPPVDHGTTRRRQVHRIGLVVKRAISSFHRDEQGDWVAGLDCGHGQHVRHRPPFVNRPWVICDESRKAMLGVELDCPRCEAMEWPDDFAPYRRTREFDETTLPSGLAKDHATSRGVWARIHVVSGSLRYHVGAPVGRAFLVEAAAPAIIVPEVVHRVEALGTVRFFIEFWRARRMP